MGVRSRLLLGTSIVVLASAAPTTWPAGVSATATSARASGAEATIIIGSAQSARGEPIIIEVRLETTVEVDGLSNQIVLGPEIALVTDERGEPACGVNPAIGKPSTSFERECDGFGVCRLRALMFSFGNVNPIPSGSILYSCRIVITDRAQNGFSYPLECQAPFAADPDGNEVVTACVDGIVTASDLPPTFTSPTRTPDRPSATPIATATRTSTSRPPPVSPSPTQTPPPHAPNDDGCQIVAARPRPLAWLLLVPPFLRARRAAHANKDRRRGPPAHGPDADGAASHAAPAPQPQRQCTQPLAVHWSYEQ